MKLAITLHNNLGQTKILQWIIRDSNLATRWAALIKNNPRQNEHYHSEFDWYTAGHTQSHFDKIVSNMATICKKLNADKGFNIPGHWFENVTRESLNQLHLEFHKLAERSPDDSDVNQLNYIVHNAESCLANIKWGKKFSNLIVNFNVFANMPLLPEDYLEFDTYSIEPGMLILGYDTIGKSLFHCYNDNDIDLIKQQMIRPKLTLSPATNCYIAGQFEEMEPGQYYKWCDDNNILGKYGYNCRDPLHTGGYCVIGTPINWDADVLTEWMVSGQSIRVQHWELQD
jgi:hypothetical protein